MNSVQIRIGDNKRSETFVTKLPQSAFSGYGVILPGTYVEVEVDYLNKDYNKPEIVKVVKTSNDPSKPLLTIDEYNFVSIFKDLQRDVNGNVLVNEANKTALEDAKTKYNAFSETIKADNPVYKSALNVAIQQYNSNAADKLDLVD